MEPSKTSLISFLRGERLVLAALFALGLWLGVTGCEYATTTPPDTSNPIKTQTQGQTAPFCFVATSLSQVPAGGSFNIIYRADNAKSVTVNYNGQTSAVNLDTANPSAPVNIPMTAGAVGQYPIFGEATAVDGTKANCQTTVSVFAPTVGLPPPPPPCSHETDQAFCGRLSLACGTFTGADNCGTMRSANCGASCLDANKECKDNQCVAKGVTLCQPESDQAFCSRYGKNCGSVPQFDNCGASRTVASCGTCTVAGQTCGGSGTANVCGTAAAGGTPPAGGGGTPPAGGGGTVISRMPSPGLVGRVRDFFNPSSNPPPAPADTTPPTLSPITLPSGLNVTAGSTQEVDVSASDNVGVSGVQFKLDGVNIESELPTPNPFGFYAIAWHTTGVNPGLHSLSAVARDATGNTNIACCTFVQVSAAPPPPPPPVACAYPATYLDGRREVPLVITGYDDVNFTGKQSRYVSDEDHIRLNDRWSSLSIAKGPNYVPGDYAVFYKEEAFKNGSETIALGPGEYTNLGSERYFYNNTTDKPDDNISSLRIIRGNILNSDGTSKCGDKNATPPSMVNIPDSPATAWQYPIPMILALYTDTVFRGECLHVITNIGTLGGNGPWEFNNTGKSVELYKGPDSQVGDNVLLFRDDRYSGNIQALNAGPERGEGAGPVGNMSDLNKPYSMVNGQVKSLHFRHNEDDYAINHTDDE